MRQRWWTMGVVVAGAAILATGAFGGSGSGTIMTIAGSGKPGFAGDGGPALAGQLRSMDQVAVDGQGNVYIADFENRRVRKVSASGTITTFAGRDGGGAFPANGSRATSARLDAPHGVAVDAQGNVYVSDTNNGRVYRVTPGGTITTFAGTGQSSFSGDGGPATSARLYGPAGLAVDGQGNVYIADSYNQRVRKVSPSGTITTFAGTGKQGTSGNGGPATSAQLSYPSAVAADAQGNVYISGTSESRVRKVSRAGTITAFAGKGAGVFSGDGGPATSAGLKQPTGVAADGQGNVYIADTANYRVRKVSPSGTITTFAGTGAGGFSGDGGPATSAHLFSPHGVAVDGKGNVYVADTANYRVRKVGASATATATHATFYSPSRNLNCEMADRDARGSYVYCQSVKAPKNVRMSLDGRLKICRGTKCLGNPAENTLVLGYGRKVTIGRFACSSQKSGVACRVVRSGKGFLISRTGVRRIGR